MNAKVKICGVKICGIKSFELIDACAHAGANYIGFVNIAKSPRYVESADMAALIEYTPANIKSVVLTMNPSSEEVAQIANYAADYIQLHGDEAPEFCQNIKNTTRLKIIKAISVDNIDDINTARAYQDIVDILLFDTKPIDGEELPGGNGKAFNWKLLKDQQFNCQTMLAGGLNASNVRIAMQQSGIDNVDISSAVEISRGHKDKALIEAFIQSVKGKK